MSSDVLDSKDWSEMLPEILDIIAKKHNLYHEDYICFSRVCRSWCSAAVRAGNKYHYPNGLPSRFPCLLLAHKKHGYDRRRYFMVCPSLSQFNTSLFHTKDDDLQLFCPLNKSIHKISLPEGTGELYISLGGRLLTIGDDLVVKLINPFSREIIYLPKICTFPSETRRTSNCGIGFRKVVLVESSSLSLVVVLLWGCRVNLNFCRCNDENWTSIGDTMLLDITYHNGRIYGFSFDYQIKACDVSDGNPTAIVTVSTLPEDLYSTSLEKYINRTYIMGLEDNGLLVVIRKGAYGTNDWSYKTTSFRVFKYDLDSEEWSEVKNLGTKALFVGYGQSFLMEEDSRGVIKGNCIYFSDDFMDLSGVGGGRDMGVYHMSSQTVEHRFHRESHSHFTLPIWIQPAV